jgi:hypothetical protein
MRNIQTIFIVSIVAMLIIGAIGPSVQEALALHDSLGHNQGITHRSEESLGQDTPADESANNNNDHGKECGNLDDEDAHSGFTNTPSDQPPGCID